MPEWVGGLDMNPPLEDDAAEDAARRPANDLGALLALVGLVLGSAAPILKALRRRL